MANATNVMTEGTILCIFPNLPTFGHSVPSAKNAILLFSCNKLALTLKAQHRYGLRYDFPQLSSLCFQKTLILSSVFIMLQSVRVANSKATGPSMGKQSG